MPQSLLTTHFGIKADSLDQKVKCIQNLLFAAVDRLQAGSSSWSDAIRAVVLSPAPPPLEQHLCNPEYDKAVKLESVPPQPKVHLHAAVPATSVCLEATPAMTDDHNQSDVTPAGGIDSSLLAADVIAMAAADVVATTAADKSTAGDVVATTVDATATADEGGDDDDAVAADAPATNVDHTATAAAADADAATAHASQVVLGSGKVGTDEETPPCHIVPQAKGSPVYTAPLDGSGVQKPQRGTIEQTDMSTGARSSQAQPQQMKPSAAQLPATLLPASRGPARQPHYSLTPALVHSSATGPQMSAAAPSSVTIDAASSSLLLPASQPMQLALSSARVAPPVPAQHSSPAAERLPQQLPCKAASSLQTEQIPRPEPAGAQELQAQLLHGAKPICKQPRPADAAQRGSTGLLASHTHRKHDSVPPGHQSTTAAPQVTACQDLRPLQAVSTCSQRSAPHQFTSKQQPGSKTSLNMQQSASSFQTAQLQQQRPPQLLGPASQKLHSLLLQLERTGHLHTTMHSLQALNPVSSSNHCPSFPDVLLRDPGLLSKVQSTLQECAQEGRQGLNQAQSQARHPFDALIAS